MVVQYYEADENGDLYQVLNEVEATHILLDIEDYERLKRIYESGNVESVIAKAKNVSSGNPQPTGPNDADKKRIQELEKALRLAKNQAAYERKMNEGFRRIFKERSNSDRNLKPKKKHTGYVIQLSAEKEKYGFGNKGRQMFNVMETVLQTPYDAKFSLGQVKIETMELTRTQSDGTRLVDVVGLGPLYRPQVANAGLSAICNEVLSFNKEKFEQARRENLILFRQFKFNAKSGYWEVTLTHMAPLTCYHATMMPSKGKKKDQEHEDEE